MDWIGAGLIGVGLAGVVVSYQSFLHSRNVKAKDQDREFHEERAKVVDRRFDQIDDKHVEFNRKFADVERDITGLTVQLVANRNDANERFLTKDDNNTQIARLEATMGRLADNFERLHALLFDLVRGRTQ